MDAYEWVNATDIKGTLAVGSSCGLWVSTLAGVIGGSRGCATGRYPPHCARFREERATVVRLQRTRHPEFSGPPRAAALGARRGRRCHVASGDARIVQLDVTSVARRRSRYYPRRRAYWCGSLRTNRRLPDHLVLLAFSFVVLGIVSALWAAVWWWSFHEDLRRHPRITSAELAALPTADPARQIGSGPVPWRRLIPRVAPR
jgi:hypothetical protein